MTRAEKLALAGDYALGLMDDTERAAFEALRETDAELAAMADSFAQRLQSLDDTVKPAGYDAALWSRIERQLDAGAPEDSKVVSLPARRRSAMVQRWLPLAASVVIALGVGFMTGLSTRTATQPTVIAIMLNEADGSPAVIVEAFADDSVRLVPLESFVAPEGQVLEVWTLPDVATGPVSLGTLDATRNIRLTGPDLPTPTEGQLYEITLEPAPGSPTGRPTGPILVKGLARTPIS